MSLLDNRCLAPINTTPGVTTSFCVYERGHDDVPHSWAMTAEARRERVVLAEQRIAERPAPGASPGAPPKETP